MTEKSQELQAAIAEMVNKLNVGADFAIEQAPEVVQQMLLLHRVNASLWLVLAILICWATVNGLRYTMAHWNDIPESQATAYIGGLLIGMFFMLFIPLIVTEFFEVFFTPKWHIVSVLLK